MGKRLIINGADFSTNAIENVILQPVDITSQFVMTRATLVWTPASVGDNRASNTLANGVNITSYLEMGYTRIRITHIAEKWMCKANDSNTTYNNNMNNCVYANDSTGGTWDTADFSGTLNSSYPYLYVGLSGTSNFPSTIDLSDYVTIQLLP